MSERVQITDDHVIVAFIRHSKSAVEEWGEDYWCLPLNALTSWWTNSDFIHVQVAFKVRLWGKDGRCQNKYMTFSVDSRRNVYRWPDKQFSDEFSWEFFEYSLNKIGMRRDGSKVRQIESAYRFCDAQVGKPHRFYSAVLGCGSAGSSYTCTELVMEMFHEVGELEQLSSNISPGELYDVLSTCDRAIYVPHIINFGEKDIHF